MTKSLTKLKHLFIAYFQSEGRLLSSVVCKNTRTNDAHHTKSGAIFMWNSLGCCVMRILCGERENEI